ncbi:MAG: hypothetical protein AB1640_09975 [bacterium]
MYTEPGVPFYMVLSVYLPLLLMGYLAVFLALMVRMARFCASLVHGKEREERPRRVGLAYEPGRA